ncbi:MAG TPA: SDR family oxidoreductase [Roseiflexaceae bacterium]|nr:SDR family oxidoreductase [Roseiflexaceae bacterium]
MPYHGFDLTNSSVVITGAGRGLGAGLAEAFATAGARITIADLQPELAETTAKRLQNSGTAAIAVACDIRDAQQVAELRDQAIAAFGTIDVWINNAGINIPGPAATLELAEWNQIIATNLTGTFIGCRAAGEIMLARGRGSIINISSIHGHVGSYVHQAAAYNASKAGVINLTRSLALEWGAQGVRVNGISPGPLATELMTTRLANPEYVQLMMHRMAIKRVGTPEDVAGAALFLAAPAAAWITGQILAVDGGWLAA